jgi:hypothetical protein
VSNRGEREETPSEGLVASVATESVRGVEEEKRVSRGRRGRDQRPNKIAADCVRDTKFTARIERIASRMR